jgi:hypothetical protein
MESKHISKVVMGSVLAQQALPGSSGTPDHQRWCGWRTGIARRAALLALCATLGGCGLAAAPCRVASAGLKIIPAMRRLRPPMPAPT